MRTLHHVPNMSVTGFRRHDADSSSSRHTAPSSTDQARIALAVQAALDCMRSRETALQHA